MIQNIRKYQNLFILLIIAAGVWWRAGAYGSFYLSIGMLDTESLISSAASADSLETYFTGRRLPTMNLLYKLVNEECDLTVSTPHFGEEVGRIIQPCFDKVVLIQNIVSIFSWALLAWVVSRKLKIFPVKVFAVLAILAFGFSPHIAEWDGILSSESPSLSLFAIMLALLIDLVFRIVEKKTTSSRINLHILLWMIAFVLWALVRDVHIYAALITVALVLPLFLFPYIRNIKGIVIAVIILMGLVVVVNHTSKISPRWQPSLMHVLDYYVFPYPSRVDYFVQQGMPEDLNGEAYVEWFDNDGVKTYGLFLLSHPGFIVTTVLNTADYFRSDFIQPYFEVQESLNRTAIMVISEVLHPETNFVYAVCLFLFLVLCAVAFYRRDPVMIAWTWLATWLFLYSAASLFISYFGDIDGTRRHIFPSVEQFRLFLWIFLAVFADYVIRNEINSSKTNL